MERRRNMRNSKAVAEMIICDQEFKRAIQAMPVRELELPHGTQQRPKVESYNR
jgi:hypothetical protein